MDLECKFGLMGLGTKVRKKFTLISLNSYFFHLGQWRDNRAHGHGKFIHVDGDIYEGNWVNDKANGFGIYIHINGARYEGTWRDDL